MRSQLLAGLLLLAAPVFSSPTPGKKSDCEKTVKEGQSIQAAINKAKPGDTIYVEKGVYKEHLTVDKSDIKLIGKGAKLIPPSSYTPNYCSGLNVDFTGTPTEAGICIQGKDIHLLDFVKEHRKVDTVGQYIKNVVVSGFEVAGFSGENIAVVGGKNVKVTNNKLIDGAQYGFLTVGSKNTLAADNIVQSSTAAVYFIALCMDDHSDAKFKGNDISGYYIGLCTQTSGGIVKKNKVTNCCIGNFVDPGIVGAKIIGNTITHRNPACPTAPEPNNAGAGIIIWGASNTIVEKNTIEYITNNMTGIGIFVNDDPETGAKATGNVIQYNYLEFNEYDIFNNASSTDNVIKDNTCTLFPEGSGYCG